MADEKKVKGPNELVSAESMVQVALALPLGCVIGWVVGSWVDKHYGLHWVGVVGILLGAAGGFIQIFRTASRLLGGGRKDGGEAE